MNSLFKTRKIVISASRRTDIPAFYMGWFMDQIELGRFEVINPYNAKISYVQASPENVDTIVFWSKNFEVFIKKGYGEKLKKAGFNLFFNFTINTPDRILEPNIPELEQRLAQLNYLAKNFGNQSINWRFDPICYYLNRDNILRNNLSAFPHIARVASKAGITRCITSFMDNYGKVKKRSKKIPGFEFIDPLIKKKTDIILKMEALLTPLNINLFLCCEKDILEALPSYSKTSKSSCIDNILLKKLFGGNLSFAKDSGQRTKMGCDCKKAFDIGSYSLHPCRHNCLYCYANPKAPDKFIV